MVCPDFQGTPCSVGVLSVAIARGVQGHAPLGNLEKLII